MELNLRLDSSSFTKGFTKYKNPALAGFFYQPFFAPNERLKRVFDIDISVAHEIKANGCCFDIQNID